MSNELIPFDAAAGQQLPAHIASLFGGEGNIQPRLTINQLSYRGKIWRRVVEGEETALTRVSQDTGEQEPLPMVSLIVLDHNCNRSRSFFEGNYEEGKTAKPRCYSGDGVRPDAGVKDPIAPTCASCPNAVKGSKITESGKPSTLCSPFKRVAVIPSANIAQHPEMLLKLAQTSVWDGQNGENEAKGWYAWDNYLDMLRARGATHTAMVETRVKFDMRVAYPKLLFNASRWLGAEEAAAVKKLLADEAHLKTIEDIVNGAGDRDDVMNGAANGAMNGAETQAAVDKALAQAATATAPKPMPSPTPAAPPAPTPAPAPAKPKSPPKPTAATPAAPPIKVMTDKAEGMTYAAWINEGWNDEQLIAEGIMVLEQPKPAAKPAAPPKPKAPPKPSPAADAAHQSAAAAPPPAPAAVASTDAVPAALGDLLAGWDDGN